MSGSLTAAAVAILNEPHPAAKTARSLEAAAAWRNGDLSEIGSASPPERPARPALPELLPPRDMPRRRKGGQEGRFAFVHAIAHIEFNAIDLSWDLIARFGNTDMPQQFLDDWVTVAEDEARHFGLLKDRLTELGGAYGDLPAHDGLWQAAEWTADDLLARLAIVPMVLEARGLDTTPGAVADLRAKGDPETADLLARIGEEEVPHVAAGVRWFEYLAHRRGLDPVVAFHALVGERYPGRLKAPFNAPARDRAGMAAEYYLPLAA